MYQKAVLGQQEVARILEAAVAEAKAQEWPVTIAIADDGGHLLGMVRLDGCAPVGAYIAVEKARSAAIGRRETKDYESMINGGRTAFVSAPLLTSLEGIDGSPYVRRNQPSTQGSACRKYGALLPASSHR